MIVSSHAAVMFIFVSRMTAGRGMLVNTRESEKKGGTSPRRENLSAGSAVQYFADSMALRSDHSVAQSTRKYLKTV